MKVDLTYAFGLKPEEAIAYLVSKGARLTWDYTEMLNEAHAKEFTVAKVMRNDILADIHGALVAAQSEGKPFGEFLKELKPTLQAKGWWGRKESMDPSTGELHDVQLGSPRRLKTIYQTNLQAAYMAGDYKQNRENAANRPWWEYVAVMDRRTRPAHAALNGLIFHADDPFWETHHPPQGYNCRCTVRALAEDQAEPAARRSTVGKNPSATLTSEEVTVGVRSPVRTTVTRVNTTDLMGRKVNMAPDPGFNSNPGKGLAKLQELGREKVKAMPAEIRPAARKELAGVGALPTVLSAPLSKEIAAVKIDAEFTQWAKAKMAGTTESGEIKTIGEQFNVGFIDSEVQVKLAKLKNPVLLDTTLITITDKEFLHSLHLKDLATGKGRDAERIIPLDMALKLPKHLRESTAVLYDTIKPSLLYIFDVPIEGSSGKWAIRVNVLNKKTGFVSNEIKTAAILPDSDYISGINGGRYKVLTGKIEGTAPGIEPGT